MAPMKAAKGLILGIVSAGCVALTGCGGKGKDDENSLKGKTFGKFTILDEVQTDGGDRSLAKKNAENTLGKYPDVDAMIGLWAYNAPQCLEALKDADKLGQVKVFSCKICSRSSCWRRHARRCSARWARRSARLAALSAAVANSLTCW